MNISRKVVKVEINEKVYGMVLDFESAITYQELSGESIFEGVNKIGQKQDVMALAYLLASTLRDENDKLLGLDFVKKLDLVGSLEIFMTKLTELMENSLPKEDGKKTKKK